MTQEEKAAASSPKPRLGGLKPKDTREAAAKSAAYSRAVGRLRWLLPALALVALGLLFIWPYWNAHKISITMVDDVPNLMLENLNLTGLDAKNQPYSLTAERALQAQNTRDLVDLQAPKGEITLESGAWLSGRAQQGRLNQAEKKLWLGGSVELFHDGGYRFLSDEMQVDMAHSLAWGNQPVVIQGNFGEIYGTGFRLLNEGETLVIKGPASAKLYLHPDQGADKPNINHSQPR